MIILLLFTFGLIVGSFLNALAFRVQNSKSISGRSICPDCKKEINWYDLFPVLSWIFLRGKCRHCGKNISVQYPLIELITATAFVAFGATTQLFQKLESYLETASFSANFWEVALFLLVLIIATFLVLISLYDYKTKEIPDSFNLIFIVSCAVYAFIAPISKNGYFSWPSGEILAALVLFLFFYSFVYFSQETWMGGGDGKLVIGIGLLLGPARTLLAVLLASVIGSAVGLVLINREKAELKSEIPFGPFLALGTAISFLFGSQIVGWYVKIFLGG